jgi:hypothetical protein
MDGLDHLLPVHHQTLEAAHYQNLLPLVQEQEQEQELVSVVVPVLRVPEIVPKSAV